MKERSRVYVFPGCEFEENLQWTGRRPTSQPRKEICKHCYMEQSLSIAKTEKRPLTADLVNDIGKNHSEIIDKQETAKREKATTD